MFCMKHTANDWDQLPYAACILKLSNLDSKQAHDSVYHLAFNTYYSGELGGEYNEMIHKNLYRQTSFNDVVSFNQQLAFYQVKPLYIWLGFCFTRLGFDPIQALQWVNFLSFIIIGLILTRLILNSFSTIPALLIFITATTYNGYLDMVKELTPDMLSFFFISCISIAFLKSYNNKIIFGLSILAILTRPDNLIFCIVIQACVIIQNLKSNTPIYLNLIFSFIFLITYGLVNYFTQAYSWNVLFHHAFIELISYPENIHPHFSSLDYFKIVLKGLDNILPLVALLGFLIVIFKDLMRFKLLFIGLVLTIILKFVLFPSISERFYLVYIYIIFIVLIQIYQEKKGFINN
jgi:hypothetical protein